MIKYFNFSLKDYNSFGFDVSCDSIIFLESNEDIEKYLPREKPPMILGGGSNLLFVDDVNEELIKISINHIETVYEDNNFIYVNVGAGYNWHEFVLWAISHDYGGIENLSLIPGTVGATPIQNIGAYGVEIKSLVEQVYTYEIATGAKRIFTNLDCQFNYRDSIFKRELQNQYLISEVQFKLTKSDHKILTSYGPLTSWLQERAYHEPTIQQVSKAVIDIRQSKLPDPKVIGNAGSFFKNPIITKSQFEELKASFSDIKFYPVDKGFIKIPAAWLIDKCAWKGYRKADVGVHEKHALVLVNYGEGTGSAIYDLSIEIMESVQQKFGILLEREVNLVPNL